MDVEVGVVVGVGVVDVVWDVDVVEVTLSGELLDCAGWSKARIWMAARSPFGSCDDAKMGSAIAETTTVSKNERFPFFILKRCSVE